MAPSTLRRPQSLADQAADQIRRRIVRGDFQLGEALSETTLAVELGVSKTPIREAFLRLETEGLVDIQPQRGTFVFRMSTDEVRALTEYRDILETAALRLGMQRDAAGLGLALMRIVADMKPALARADAETYREQDNLFHMYIIDHCGNMYLSGAYAVIAFRIQALRNRLSLVTSLNVQSLEEHQALADIVGLGLHAEAVALLKKHITATADEYERAIRRSTGDRSAAGAA